MAAQPDAAVGSQQVTIKLRLAHVMRILIAPDSFKETLTSTEAAAAMAKGIKSVLPEAEIITMPMADGGEGTLDVLLPVLGGELRNNICFFQYQGRPHALIESARFIGLSSPSMSASVRNRGSTALGEAVTLVLDEGTRDIWISLGGSATSDGGLGLLISLGCSVTDLADKQVSADLQGLLQVKHINISSLDQRLAETRITVLSDVQNPLCGEQGAVYVYGPQKGIKGSEVAGIDIAMQRWAWLCEGAFDASISHEPGVGAAGGIGFALKLLDGKIVSGAQFVMQKCWFNQLIKTADWVITGEGRSDSQTLNGKLPMVVATAARKHGIKVALISGDIEPSPLLARAFDAVIPARPAGMPFHVAMYNAEELLRKAATLWADST
jgi:glycerate kinase